ncbi:MAG: inositol monophosphatase family protein, partial [Devosia sp.]
MRSALLNVMVQAALAAGKSLVRDFGEVEHLQVSRKGPADFVSNADRRAEQVVFDALRKARPTYAFLMEEGGEVAGSDGQHRWVADPPDGTTNFLHGNPMFAVAIALERGDEIVASVI